MPGCLENKGFEQVDSGVLSCFLEPQLATLIDVLGRLMTASRFVIKNPALRLFISLWCFSSKSLQTLYFPTSLF
jgi:hypothetical protein